MKKDIQNQVLFTPGPVSVSDSILQELSKPIIFHRNEDFKKLYSSLQKKITLLLKGDEKHKCIFPSGSGTLAVEMAISSLFDNREDRILILNNGQFGERWIEMLTIYKLKYQIVFTEWGSEFNIKEITNTIYSYKPTALIMVGMETSTGMVNPIHEVGNLCKKNNIIYLLDAVSAFGAENINIKKDNIDILITVPNKAIESISGVGIICLSKKIIERKRRVPIKSMYLDIWSHIEFGEKLQTPSTPSISSLVALNRALDMLIKEKISNRIKRYKLLIKIVEEYAKRLKLRNLIDNKNVRSNAVTSLIFPKFVDLEKLRIYLRKKRLIIWHKEVNKSHMKNMAQISVMGCIKNKDLHNLFHQIESFMKNENTKK